MQRLIKPEWLDALPPEHSDAIRSRRDLHRVNAWMGNPKILARALRSAVNGRTLQTLLDLGAGDGHCLLQAIQHLGPPSPGARVLLLDRFRLLRPETGAALCQSGWRAEPVQSDVFDWLRQPGDGLVDAVVANLFLHQFADDPLRELLRLAAQRTPLIVAVEPRRTPLARIASRLLWVIGCNAVTCCDGAISVDAGFVAGELRSLWPAHTAERWHLTEQPAGPFSHLFVARRHLSTPATAQTSPPISPYG